MERSRMQKNEELTGRITFLTKLLVIRRGSGCGELAVDIFPLNDRRAARHKTLLEVRHLSDDPTGVSTDLPRVRNEEVPEGHPPPFHDFWWEAKPCAVSVFKARNI